MVSATEAQAVYLEANWDLMESYVDQVIENNVEYHKHCVAGK